MLSPGNLGAAGPTVEIDAWRALSELRLHLAAAGDLTGNFTQTYVPAGFSTGDEEGGTIALALPDCLRWDYLLPYPKSYLLCGIRLHSWVRGEPLGQRTMVHAEDEVGLDLLLLPIDRLRERYRATAKAGPAGAIAVDFVPQTADVRLAEATLTFDPASQRPLSLAYRDREGNRTQFRFDEFRLVEDATIFTPPPALEWKEP